MRSPYPFNKQKVLQLREIPRTTKTDPNITRRSRVYIYQNSGKLIRISQSPKNVSNLSQKPKCLRKSRRDNPDFFLDCRNHSMKHVILLYSSFHGTDYLTNSKLDFSFLKSPELF
jgi:hypothetical protein